MTTTLPVYPLAKQSAWLTFFKLTLATQVSTIRHWATR